MKLVSENINEVLDFERGQDPKKAMNIGKTLLDKKFIEETPWAVPIDEDSLEIVELHKNFYKGYPALVMIDHGAIMKTSPRYFANSILGINSKYRGSPKLALENLKDIIKWKLEKRPAIKDVHRRMAESQAFTREGDPLKKMSVGQTAIDQHIIDTTLWALRKEMWENYEVIELIRDYRGFPILVLFDPTIDPEQKSNMSVMWIATSTMSYTNWSSSKEYAIKKMKEIIDDLLSRGKIQSEINKFKIKHGEPVEEGQNFTREGDPLPKMGIGRNRIPSKMGGSERGYRALFNDELWSIEQYFNPNVGKPSLIVASDDPPLIDYPILYDNGNIAWNYPEKVPAYIKSLVHKFYPEIRKTNEAQQFTRKGDPIHKMGIGREVRLNQLNKEIGWDWDVKKYPDFVEEQVMDIFPYKSSPDEKKPYFIKVSRIWFITFNPNEVQKKYMITSNVGESYPSNGPDLYKDESEIPNMIAREKKWIDEYLESM